MKTATIALPLHNGATNRRRITLTASDDDLAFHTIARVRMDLRPSMKSPALLRLDTAAADTPGGSSLVIVSATASVIVLRLTIGAVDSAALPYSGEFGADLEFDHPSAEIDRPLRIFWTPDGEYTHP